MSLLKISGAVVYDPANGVAGETRDLWLEGGKVVAPPADPSVRPTRSLDARGYVVMPGGVDMHCHISGPKVNVARKMRPEEKRNAPVIRRHGSLRSGTTGSVPSTFATGYLYAGLGYTTAVDAAIPPLYARHAHEEFQDTPIIDKAFLTLVGNNHYVMNQIREGESGKLDAYLAWLLGAVKGFGLKVVNPGGIEEWKEHARKSLAKLDDQVDQFRVTPRQILREVAAAADRLAIPHAMHVHCNNLGIPGNWKITLETMQALEGHRGHFAHIQFHSYAGGADDEFSFASAVPKLADYVNDHSNLTVDVGHVNFGPTTSLTGDGPLGYYLHKVTGNKWFSGDTEMETGCGIVPIEYRDKNLIHAIQWSIGLEWYLLMNDPWRIAMSTDHPNGGAFLRYPEIIQLLMDAAFRREVVQALPERIRKRTVLADLNREYTLEEIAIVTRAAPAKILGIEHKGHLGIGADADVTIYSRNDDIRAMFAMPRYVIKGGEVVVDDGELRGDSLGETLYVAPSFDGDVLPDIQRWFEANYSLQFANYPVADHYLPKPHEIPLKG
ncbi:MAG: formylmethanofuran dehydrogenase subunit A [Planctomycetota bacterium]